MTTQAMLTDVSVKQGRRYFTAKVEGFTYEIPELWSIGYCQSHPGTDARDAAVAWHEQAAMEREFEAQRRSQAASWPAAVEHVGNGVYCITPED